MNPKDEATSKAVEIMISSFVAAMKEFDVDDKTIKLILLEVPIRMRLLTGLFIEDVNKDLVLPPKDLRN